RSDGTVEGGRCGHADRDLARHDFDSPRFVRRDFDHDRSRGGRFSNFGYYGEYPYYDNYNYTYYVPLENEGDYAYDRDYDDNGYADDGGYTASYFADSGYYGTGYYDADDGRGY